jgi:hypothetical protein
MMLSAFTESMILSAPVVTAVIVAATDPLLPPLLPLPPPLSPHFPLQHLVDSCFALTTESMVLSAPAESIILSVGSAEMSIILSVGSAEMSIILSAHHAESSCLVVICYVTAVATKKKSAILTITN